LIGVERIFATYFVESCVNFCKLDCDPGSHLSKFGIGGCSQHQNVATGGRLLGIVGCEFVV